MTFRAYMSEQFLFLLINVVLFSLLSGIILLIDTSIILVLLLGCSWFFPLIFYMLIQFTQKKRFFEQMKQLNESLERKYLLPEMMKKPDFLEGQLFYELLVETHRDMHEHIKHYEYVQADYRQYIETWVHEIKTPLSSAHLLIDNHKNATTAQIDEQLRHVEGYIEQALYYARSNVVSNDYMIKELNVDAVVKSVIKRNARDFIQKNIAIDVDVQHTVYSDAKWLAFIVQQLLVNAMKYMRTDERRIHIYTTREQQAVTLTIADTGIGIRAADVPHVFKKGFTGENGRRFGQSTGIGLYLCKTLAEQLGIAISLTSVEQQGTIVQLTFPQDTSQKIQTFSS